MSQDFTKAKIYKITNDYNDAIYIGSTCNTLVKRFNNHKSSARRKEGKDRELYKLINEIGESRFRIELVENCPCEDKYQLRQREGLFIREMGTLNMNIAGRPKQEADKEYRKKNKDKIIEYREINKEKLTEQTKKYRDTHKDKIDEINKIYRIKNKDKFKERNMEIILCTCGCSITFGNKQRHEKTKKHIQLMESLNNSENSIVVLS